MRISDVLKASSTGELPVVYLIELKPALEKIKSKKGQVTVIKNSEGFRGIAVRFEGLNYDTWFYEEDGKDKRKNYMANLTLENNATN